MPACCAPSSSRSSPFSARNWTAAALPAGRNPAAATSFPSIPCRAARPARWSFAAGPVSNSPRRFHLALWPRPAGQQRPYCPQLCQCRGDRTCGPAVYHLRAACHTGKAGGYPLCIRNRPWRGAHRLNFRSLAVLHKHRSFPHHQNRIKLQDLFEIKNFSAFLSLNSAISSIFSVLYCASCTVFLICQNYGISKRQNVRQGTYKWRGMVVLWRHKERSKEGAETEHRRFLLSVFLLGALFIR